VIGALESTVTCGGPVAPEPALVARQPRDRPPGTAGQKVRLAPRIGATFTIGFDVIHLIRPSGRSALAGFVQPSHRSSGR
jgi:hypothetical protein